KPDERRDLENYGVERIDRCDTLLAPSKPRQNRAKILIDRGNYRPFLLVFWKDVGVDDLIEVLMIEIVDLESLRDAGVTAVSRGDIIVECDGDEHIRTSAGLGQLA